VLGSSTGSVFDTVEAGVTRPLRAIKCSISTGLVDARSSSTFTKTYDGQGNLLTALYENDFDSDGVVEED